MSLSFWVDIVVFGTTIPAGLLIRAKNKWGWIVYLFANVGLLYIAIDKKLLGMIGRIIISVVIQITAAIKWFKEDKISEKNAKL